MLMKKLSAILFIMSIGFAGAHYWIHAKALLAQFLIAKAWHATQMQGTPQKPWHWADTWPAAKLSIPSHKIEQYVLANASGQSLAFGPGLLTGQESLEKLASKNPGLIIISGHRDTHFRFVEFLKVGDEITIENNKGVTGTYRITTAEIKNSQEEQWLVNKDNNELKLITCYPFDAINAGGPLRYIVSAAPYNSYK